MICLPAYRPPPATREFAVSVLQVGPAMRQECWLLIAYALGGVIACDCRGKFGSAFGGGEVFGLLLLCHYCRGKFGLQDALGAANLGPQINFIGRARPGSVGRRLCKRVAQAHCRIFGVFLFGLPCVLSPGDDCTPFSFTCEMVGELAEPMGCRRVGMSPQRGRSPGSVGGMPSRSDGNASACVGRGLGVQCL